MALWLIEFIFLKFSNEFKLIFPRGWSPMRSHPPTVIFLNFYDVICLNNPYGGYDAKRALAQQESSQNQHNFDIWSKLFDAKAKANLRAINEEFSPKYVLSTSWVWIFEKDEIVEVLKRTGLDFVVEGSRQLLTCYTEKERTLGD